MKPLDVIRSHWLKSSSAREKLGLRAALMALDIPDEMQIQANRGLTWREIIAVGVVLGGLGWLANAAGVFDGAGKPAVEKPAEPGEIPLPAYSIKLSSSKAGEQ